MSANSCLHNLLEVFIILKLKRHRIFRELVIRFREASELIRESANRPFFFVEANDL